MAIEYFFVNREESLVRGVKTILAAALCLAAVPVPAQAEGMAIGAGSAGSVDITQAGRPTSTGPIAPCETGAIPASRSGPVRVGSNIRYGPSETACTRNADGAASVSVSGQRFETTILAAFGGPTIKIRTYEAGCRTTANGSSGYLELSGVSGFDVPSQIPANYTVTIPSVSAARSASVEGGGGAADGASPSALPMAEVVLNEVIVPSPPDGSLVTHAVHIRLFPHGGPDGGDIVVGSAACAP